LKQLKFGGNHTGIIDAWWAINEAPVQLEVPWKKSCIEIAWISNGKPEVLP